VFEVLPPFSGSTTEASHAVHIGLQLASAGGGILLIDLACGVPEIIFRKTASRSSPLMLPSPQHPLRKVARISHPPRVAGLVW